jgi:ABC-type transport system involved in multi-copper enzyme maturation permease subunit
MTAFKSFFILEFKRLFFSKRKWIVMGIFLLICFFLVQLGIWQYRDIEKGKETFRELERKKVEQIVNWDQYGLYGFHLFFMSSQLSTLFFNSNHFTELTCHIDSGEKLNTFSLFKGKKIFEEKPGKLLDFSGIILILGSFIALFYGFDAFRYTEYIKSLASMYGYRQTFFYIWLSRVILLCVFFIGVTLIATLLMVINGIKIKGDGWVHLSVFFLIMLMMQVFFLTLGAMAKSFRSALISGIFIILFWIFFVYIIPAGLNKIVEAKAGKMPSYYQVELDKLKIVMAYEKVVKEKKDIYKKLTAKGGGGKENLDNELAAQYSELYGWYSGNGYPLKKKKK